MLHLAHHLQRILDPLHRVERQRGPQQKAGEGEDGRHGVLYPDWEGPSALAEAIDKASRMRFNSLDLRDRAKSFSVATFTGRIHTLLSNRFPS